jgi:mannose-6-phosphate isomerase-like protein (cupin superfamily)
MEKVKRPWGWYENLLEDSGYKVKRLYVNSDQSISLQYHNFRNEHWVVVSGDGIVEIDGVSKNIFSGDYIFVPLNSKHRIIGGKCGIIIVEVQMGEVCEETDIVRIEDQYGRI